MKEISTIAVIGAGTMGAGIAQVAAQAGYATSLCDLDQDRVGDGLSRIRQFLDKGISRGKVTPDERDTTLDRLRTTTDLEDACTRADCIIEAVPEQMELKQKIFREVAKHCRPDAILATNTSSLSVDDLASGIDRPERFLGMHFFNPVPIMKLLEVVVSTKTDPDIVTTAREIGTRMGKSVITVRDSPGFATTRLGNVLGMEAIRMLEEGVASAEDIDTAMTLGYGHPMGPLRLTDLIGLDVRLSINESLYRLLGEEVFRPPDLLREMVREGKLGKKSGRGFYDWSG